MSAVDRAPARYRSLLVLHPRPWRRRHADVVLAVLMEAHTAAGRTSPTLAERVLFALDGLHAHLDGRRRRTSISVRRPDLAAGAMQFFDQTSGAAPESSVDAASQVRANLHDLRGAPLRGIGVPAWIGLGRRAR